MRSISWAIVAVLIGSVSASCGHSSLIAENGECRRRAETCLRVCSDAEERAEEADTAQTQGEERERQLQSCESQCYTDCRFR